MAAHNTFVVEDCSLLFFSSAPPSSFFFLLRTFTQGHCCPFMACESPCSIHTIKELFETRPSTSSCLLLCHPRCGSPKVCRRMTQNYQWSLLSMNFLEMRKICILQFSEDLLYFTPLWCHKWHHCLSQVLAPPLGTACHLPTCEKVQQSMSFFSRRL